MRTLVALAALLVTLAGQSASAAPAAVAPPGYGGLYVVIYPSWTQEDGEFANALSKPFIDGATILLQWKDLQPTPETFDFARLDKWVDMAVADHKKISLGIMAGWFTPDWLYDDGHKVPKLDFAYNRSPALEAHCATLTLPLVWSPAYIGAYNRMMQEVSRHLRGMIVPGFTPGAAYSALRIVKLSGVNTTSAELRLFAGMHPHGDSGPCHQSDSPPMWAAAGFLPSRVEAAWTAMSDETSRLFPDKLLSTAIIRVNAFPAVDDGGNTYRPVPGADDVLTNRIIAIGLSRYPGRFSVQWNGLTTRPPAPAVIDAGARGAVIAWQLNGFLGPKSGTGCFYGAQREPCQSTADFAKNLDNGISLGGRFIEIWAPNVDQFAAAFEDAHAKLVH